MSLVAAQGIGRVVERIDNEPLTILADVSLRVEAGERVSIVGRSGSGKSTLLNLLGMLDLPTSGALEIAGEDVLTLSNRRRDRLRGANIGFVFQQFNLLDGRTASENVQLPLVYAGGSSYWRREALADEMLDRVGLSHRRRSLPHNLSGGEQQRVAIARALVRRPRLILADEPTGALDVETGISIMGLLDEIVAEEQSAIVTITHDPAIAALSERHYRLASGSLEEAVFA